MTTNEIDGWWKNVGYEETVRIIDANIQTEEKTLNSLRRTYIAIGWYLRNARNKELFLEGGYRNVWDFAKDKFGYSRSKTSRLIDINAKFSKGGNSPILDERYHGFNTSQLQEMLSLQDDQLEEVTPDMTVKEIRRIGKPEPMEVEPEVLEEPVSVLGYSRRVYPEDSLISTPGCGNQDCDSCHRDGCEIRGKECYCVEAPMGNPFPCTVLERTETLRQEIGNACQFVNSDLAYIRPGDGQPVPCCKKCDNPCGYECGRSAAKRDAEKQEAKDVAVETEEQDIEDLDFSIRTYSVLKHAGIDTVRQLKSMDRDQLAILKGMGARSLKEIEEALEVYQKANQAVEECATSHTKEDRLPGQMDVKDSPELMPDEPEEPEKDPEQMEIVSGEVEDAAPEGSETGHADKQSSLRKAMQGQARQCLSNLGVEIRAKAWGAALATAKHMQHYLEKVVEEESEMVAASEEPRFASLFVRDILWDKENELSQMEECDAQPDGKLPDRMMQEHRAVVAGLRLLLELTETRERREDDEEYTEV